MNQRMRERQIIEVLVRFEQGHLVCGWIQFPQHRHRVSVDAADERADVGRQDGRQHVVASVGEIDGRRATLSLDVTVAVGLDEVADVGDED